MASRVFTREYSQDLLIKQRTGMPQVARGPFGMGRNSTNGSIATVFGATGFMGRYLVSKLAKAGTQVVIPYRDEEEKRHLKLLGDLGQIVPLEWDIRNDQQIQECLRHSDTVFNLTGRNYATKNFSLRDVHVDGARRIAEHAAESGAARFIHVSHLSADANSESEFLRTKAQGEDAVRRAFPGATIVRPASIYGHEDRFLNKMASWPITWKLNNGQTKLRPVHSLDVAQALATIAQADSISIGQTFSLYGPKTYTIRELLQLVEDVTYQKIVSPDVNVPRFLFSAVAKLGEKVAWWPMFNADEVTRRFIDEVPEEGTKTFADLDIVPDLLEDVAIVYLRRFRSLLRYEQPIENTRTGAVKLRKQPFRVVE
ncbi:Protein-lysine N-methyltransferase Efm5 [Malassezia pachydermatis]